MNLIASKWAPVLLVFANILFILSCQNHDNPREIAQENKFYMLGKSTRPKRAQMLKKIKETSFDMIIIGGGATGAGAFLDASSRGLKVALLEGEDFSSQTSSKSTKLVHGGVRYLEKAVKTLDYSQYKLVKEALHEREVFLHNAPQFTRKLPIVTPVYSWWQAFYYLVGLKLYDFLAHGSSLGKSKFVSKKSALELFPNINREKLKGAVIYYDGQFDDSRMNISLILTGIEHGGAAVNYAKVSSLIKSEGRVKGVVCRDVLSNQEFLVHGSVVINATGVFSDQIRKMDHHEIKPMIRASRGTHILLPGSLTPKGCGLILPKTSDGRVVFLLPWQGKTLVGTTDVPCNIDSCPRSSEEEVSYLMNQLSGVLATKVQEQDVLSVWSGLRPLIDTVGVSSTAQVSREHVIEALPSGLISIAGGKWTTYRIMAQEVVDTAIQKAQLPFTPSSTKNIKLVGAMYFHKGLAKELEQFDGIPKDIAEHLVHSYGDRVDEVLALGQGQRPKRLILGYPMIESEVIYAIRHEYATNAVDVLARRCRLAFLDGKAALKALPKVVLLMAKELNWSQDKITNEMECGISHLEKVNVRF